MGPAEEVISVNFENWGSASEGFVRALFFLSGG